MHRLRWLIPVLLLWCGCAGVSARSYDDVLESGHLVIAVYRDFPPYSWLEGDQPKGIDIELGQMIAAGLGVEVRWFWLTPDENLEDDLRNAVWKGLVTDPDKKKADLMLRVPYDREFSYGMDGYGLPRNELVHIFAPYHQESWSLARNPDKTGDVRNLAIFQYEKVGVEIDSLPDTFLSGALRGRIRDNVIHYNSVYSAVEHLLAGDVAAVAGLRSQLQWSLADAPMTVDVSEDGLQELSRRRWDIGIAVKQDYRQLAYAVEDLVNARISDGTMEKLFQRYRAEYVRPSVFDQ